MFYSHQLLARKRPLGTVWMAAHLQNRLRRNHIEITNIASTVDSIMFPEAPIALRLSAFLLLGVVRIYSKKVDYLYGDYDALLTDIRTAFAHIENLNLADNASAEPFESVTMPLRSFELDAVDLDLDDSINFERTSDNNLNTEDITLEDQVPVSEDPYLDFFIKEDIDMDRDTSPQEMIPDSSSNQMEEDVPLAPGNTAAGVSDLSPSKQAEELNKSVPEACIPQEIPEIEVVRDADPNLSLPELPDILEGIAEKSLEQTENEKDTSPNSEHLLVSGEQSEPVQHNPDPPTAFASVESFGNDGVSDIAFGNESFQMAIQPTPQNEKEKPKLRKRKRFFDEHIVLSNKICTESLKDASKLVCKRRKLPCSSLDVWRFENMLRKDQIFYQSSVTGLSESLQNLFERDYVSSRSQSIGPGDVQENASANAHTSVPDVDMEIDNQQPNVDKEVLPDVDTEVERIPPVVEAETEHLQPDDNPEIEYGRFEDGSADRDFMTESMATPTPKTCRLEPHTGSLFETEVPLTDQTIRTEAVVSTSMKTPLFFSDRLGMDESASFSNIPGLLDSSEEFNFLEADTTPVGRNENDTVDTLFVRARAVAQYYLENHSPAPETSQDQIGSLSLNKILHGKTRKQCARMFYETLVLTSLDCIKVHQEEAYGDISLTLTSRLKTQF